MCLLCAGKYGVMFYNSLFMLPPAAIFAWQTGDLQRSIGNHQIVHGSFDICKIKYFVTFQLAVVPIIQTQPADRLLCLDFDGWQDRWFLAQFLLSCGFGFILILATVNKRLISSNIGYRNGSQPVNYNSNLLHLFRWSAPSSILP